MDIRLVGVLDGMETAALIRELLANVRRIIARQAGEPGRKEKQYENRLQAT